MEKREIEMTGNPIVAQRNQLADNHPVLVIGLKQEFQAGRKIGIRDPFVQKIGKWVEIVVPGQVYRIIHNNKYPDQNGYDHEDAVKKLTVFAHLPDFSQ